MSLGNFLKIDHLTSVHSRGKFARICVEIDLEKPLVSHIGVRGCPLYIEYEGLHSICFRCGRFGHKKDQCREILEDDVKVQLVEGGEPMAEAGKDATMHVDGRADITSLKSVAPVSPCEVTKDKLNDRDTAQYGPWMIAKSYMGKKNRGDKSYKRDPTKPGSDKKDSYKSIAPHKEGSRFNALSNAEDSQKDVEQEINEGDLLKNKISNQTLEVEVVPETQLGQLHKSPISQRIRNPRVGKNTQVSKPKEIKVNAKKNFKKKHGFHV